MSDFEILLKRISPVLKRITFKLGGYHTFLNEEDLYQEALVFLWQKLGLGELSDKTDSYILQGCYFHLKNYIRKKYKKINFISIDNIINAEEDNTRSGFSLKDEKSLYYRDELNARFIADSIRNNGLDDREKEIVGYYAQGLTTRDIGKRLGLSHVRIVKITAEIRVKCRKHIDY